MRPLSRIQWGGGTLRRFGRDAVPDETLRTILGLAGQAPASGHRQPWRFVVVRDQHGKERLSKALDDGARCIGAPVIIVAYGRRDDGGRAGGTMFEEDALPDSNATSSSACPCPTLLSPVQARDTGLWLTRHVMTAFTYLMMAAEALGWDTAPLENFDPRLVRDVLELPEDAEVVALLALGRCEEREVTATLPLPLEKFVCMERFGVPWGGRATIPR